MRHFGVRSILVMLLAGACHRDEFGTGVLHPSSSQARVLVLSANTLTLDEEFTRTAADYPQFGGLFEHADSVAVVMSEQGVRTGVIDAVAGSFFAKHRGELAALAHRPRFAVEGRYNFAELSALRDGLYRAGLPQGVVLVDIDERRNRLVLGVDDPKRIGVVADELGRRGELSDAVLLEPAVLPPPISDLQNAQRPVVAGVGLAFTRVGGGSSQCTMGWLAMRRSGSSVDSTKRYFVTASHCAATGVGGLDATAYYQGGNGTSADYVGQEELDPTPTAGAGCPSGWLCRFSDASLIRMPNSVLWVHGASAWSSFSPPPGPVAPYNGYFASPTVASSPQSFGVVGIATGKQSGGGTRAYVLRQMMGEPSGHLDEVSEQNQPVGRRGR